MPSSEPLKTALERKRKALFVSETGKTYREEIVRAAEAVYAEALEDDEQMAEVGHIHDLDIRVLDLTTDRYMVAVQQRNETEVARRETTETAKQIAKTGANEYRAVKRRVIGRHGKAGLRVIGMDSNPVSQPDALLEQLEYVHSVATGASAEWPLALPGRKSVNRADVARLIKEQIDDLKPAVGNLTTTTKIAEEALLRKNKLEELLDTRYRGISRHIEGRLRMAGLDEIADRLRLSRRARPSQAPGETPPPTPPGDGSQDRPADSDPRDGGVVFA